MAIEDYIPNIFGAGMPSYIPGLLGQEEATALQKRANVQGLLGAALSLAQGMSPQGAPRSAAQNIIGALAGGLQAGQGAYQGALQNFQTQQQIALQQRQMAGVQAMKQKYPDLADEFDTNPAGAFRIVSEREAALRRPTTVGEGQTLVSPTGEVIFQAPGSRKKNTAVVGNTLIDLETGQPIYQAPAEAPKPVVVGGNLVDPTTGNVVFAAPKEQKAPETKDFADGTTRQYDPATQSWKVVARKPQGEGKTMYESKPTVDANGQLVFLPTRPGLPVVDAATGKPVNYAPATQAKQLPTAIQKSEEEDFDNGQAAINLANDAQRYLGSITSGQIKFGVIDRARIAAQSALGSNDPDVVARNEFERFKTMLVNESLRLNKGTQTEGDAVRAARELQGAESAADAGKAIATLRDINARRAKDYQTSITRRRKNAKVGDPEVNLDVPKFEPYVFTNADYSALPKGTTYIDPNGQRRVKQ